MIEEKLKTPKVALCRKCHGRGLLVDEATQRTTVCPQCEGSGRVTVSCRMILDIRPYRIR